MKYNIRGNVKSTQAINEYIEDKLSKMEKFMEDSENIVAKIVFETRGINQKVEVTIPYKNFQLRAEDSAEDVYSAVDKVTDKLQRQFRKYKTKLVDKKRRDEFIEELEDIEEENVDIVKRKSIFLKPMDEEEAITQMNLLDHSFFIFKDVHDKKIKVLYKRNDGNLGLIETE